jgi:ribonuclease Z
MIQLYKYKGMYVTGYSRSAHRTGIEIKGLDILLDAGLDIQKAYTNIFISHQHLDHVIYLPQYTLNLNLNSDSDDHINIISTENILSNIKPYLISSIRMTKNIQSKTTDETILKIMKTQFIPLSYNNFYNFNNGKEKWSVELIKCTHSVESVGFGFSVEKNKLKQEYANLSNNEIKKIKKDGVNITNIINEKIFLFLGDTNKNILLNKSIYEYPSIIIECTYIYDNEIELAKKNKHIHWNDIKSIIIENNQIQFILIHFSMKYLTDEIKTFFNEQKLNNLYYLI